MALVEDAPPGGTPRSPEALIEEARERKRRRRRRAGAALIGLLILGGGGVVLFAGGGNSVVPTVHGPLPAGIAARAADPAGGLPWGVRLVRAGGWTCLQLGRLRGDQLGLIGRDDWFHNDGRFHPFGPSATYQASCAPNDGNGHAFMTIELGSLPASAAVVSWTGTAGCDLAIDVAGFKRALARSRRLRRGGSAPSAPPTCPAGDQRFIQYGLLGPDATSVTYTYDGRAEVERTHGADGAYLVVGPAIPAFCAQLPRTGFCGSNGTAPNSLFGGMILSVRYRDGRTCQPAALEARLPASILRCPRLGYVAPQPLVRESQVAAPVSVRVITAKHYCFTRNDYLNPGSGPAQATDTGPYIPCDGPVPANEIRDPLHAHGSLIVFSWIARQPVNSPSSRYEFLINSPCGTAGGGSTYGHIPAGERLTRGMFEPSGCTGTFTGSVGYNPNVGPGGFTTSYPRVARRGLHARQVGSILVGRFSITTR